MRILVLSPHTDDAEFGCGGMITRYVEETHEVHIAAFSTCGETSLHKEFAKAARTLGVLEDWLHLFDFPVRAFPATRQVILERMILLRQDIAPDLVFLPCSADTHQDHQIIRQEGFRAFKKCTILGYELPWNNIKFTATAFAVLSDAYMERKMDALACYASQSDRRYADPSSIEALARVRGTQVGTQWAEAFEVIRWVI